MKLRMIFAEFEFDAEGSEEAVRSALEILNVMLAASPAVPKEDVTDERPAKPRPSRDRPTR